MKFLFALVLLILPTYFCYAENSHTLVGKIHELKETDSRNIYGHQFYLVIQNSQGKNHAYPIVLKGDKAEKEKLEKLIRENKSEQFIVKARPRSTQVKPRKGSEVSAQIVELEISDLKTMNLKKLGYGKMEPYKPTGIPIGNGNVTVESPGQAKITGVNDTFTNAAIATGAAILLGSILLGK